jgi:hypothetical protein
MEPGYLRLVTPADVYAVVVGRGLSNSTLNLDNAAQTQTTPNKSLTGKPYKVNSMKRYKPQLKYRYTVPRGLLPPRQAGPRQLRKVMPLGWGIRKGDEECASERKTDKPLGEA